jgi:hypothetical protein
VVEKQRWVCQSVVAVTTIFLKTLEGNNTKTLQVGVTLAWTLLGFVGFQKSEQLHATECGLFLSSGILRWTPLELMR